MDGLNGRVACPPAEAGGVAVRVWLFGALSALAPARPVVLGLAAGFTPGDVIAALGQRCGPEFLDRVLRAPGEKFSHCRLFVNGLAIEDLGQPVEAGGATAEIEMILLIAPEGG